MARGKNMGRTSKKKNRVAKHILKAQQAQAASQTSGENTSGKESENLDKVSPKTPPVVKGSPAASKKEKGSIVKSPEEVANYLLLWKQKQEASDAIDNGWKFNKNTQSWLIRHMYESDKVSKSSFTILLEYLQGLPSKTRLLEDASQRCLRYKAFESKQQQQQQQQQDTKTNEPNTTGAKDVVDIGEEERWNALEEHEKRKEYKRARKVLEQFASEDSGSLHQESANET